MEAGVAEGKHPAIGGHQPVALTVTGGRDADDRRVQVLTAHGALEGGVAEGEDAAVAGYQPVALAIGHGGDADDRRVEVLASHGALEGRGAIGEHAAVACGEHGALVRGRREGQLFDEGTQPGVTVAVGRGQRAAVGQAPDARHAADGVEETEGGRRSDSAAPTTTTRSSTPPDSGLRPEPPLLNDPVEPTAQHCAALTQEMPASMPGAVEPGTDADASVHVAPSQCSMRTPEAFPVSSVVAPEAQQSLAPTHSRPLR